MAQSNILIDYISFTGPSAEARIDLEPGVNVICGASDTGKSFFVESLDFMFGGKELREIPECQQYGRVDLSLNLSTEKILLKRSTSGGGFNIEYSQGDRENNTLSHVHSAGKVDNLSGYLLESIGLLNKMILKGVKKGNLISLSFRNIARLVLVEEIEIQQKRSPFLSGHNTSKTSELATLKLLLTGIDDSAIVSNENHSPVNTEQIALLKSLLDEIDGDGSLDEDQLKEQLEKLDESIANNQGEIDGLQNSVDDYTQTRRELFTQRSLAERRTDEIVERLMRFELLDVHYESDLRRAVAMQESGILFSVFDQARCPHCGAKPDAQHIDEDCSGDVGPAIVAATAEIEKINRLKRELNDAVNDLENELNELRRQLEIIIIHQNDFEERLAREIPQQLTQRLRNSYSELLNQRADVVTDLEKISLLNSISARLEGFQEGSNESANTAEGNTITAGIPDVAAHNLSTKVSEILLAWNFPGRCSVHFDKKANDFIIDGKARGSSGKGLRAITHAATTLALMEFCYEQGLPHPGFVVLDSPLLAYYKPEGDDDLRIKGSNLKEKFYEYLVSKYSSDSQVVIVENEHPLESVEDQINIEIFTGNPNEGREGFL